MAKKSKEKLAESDDQKSFLKRLIEEEKQKEDLDKTLTVSKEFLERGFHTLRQEICGVNDHVDQFRGSIVILQNNFHSFDCRMKMLYETTANQIKIINLLEDLKDEIKDLNKHG